MVHIVFLPRDSNRGSLLLASTDCKLGGDYFCRPKRNFYDENQLASYRNVTQKDICACKSTPLCQVVLPDNTPTVAHSPHDEHEICLFGDISRLTVITRRSVWAFSSRSQLFRDTRHALPITRGNTNIKCLRASQHPSPLMPTQKGHCLSSQKG